MTPGEKAMAVGVNGPVRFTYMDELLRNLGGIPPGRVRLNPAPGTATLRDLIRLQKKDGRIYELVDGTLVAKPGAFTESGIAVNLIIPLGQFVAKNDLGIVTAEQGLARLMPVLPPGSGCLVRELDPVTGSTLPPRGGTKSLSRLSGRSPQQG
jgi:hypothetical protein